MSSMSFNFGLICLLALAVVYGGYELYNFRSLLAISKKLSATAVPFQSTAGEPTILVLGDSLAVGVGSQEQKETIAGRLKEYFPEVAVENVGVSGARVDDVALQLARAKKEKYSLVFAAIGANDLIRFQSVAETVRVLEPQLIDMKRRGDKVVFITAGDVGSAPFFPWFLRLFYHMRTQEYHAAFTALAEKAGVTYVNLYTPADEDPFLKDPERYFAPDYLHPSGAGYGLWFERIKKAL
jgi:lysophospholipase L1-like esterase